jgi:hypothetical protein
MIFSLRSLRTSASSAFKGAINAETTEVRRDRRESTLGAIEFRLRHRYKKNCREYDFSLRSLRTFASSAFKGRY